jgi:hypothetical protein
MTSVSKQSVLNLSGGKIICIAIIIAIIIIGAAP